jgi:polysaccharide pyruvyl transferase WcaK-like protein
MRHNSAVSGAYPEPMDPMLHIPKNRRRVPVIRLCVLMGLTALLFMLVATRIHAAVAAMNATAF